MSICCLALLIETTLPVSANRLGADCCCAGWDDLHPANPELIEIPANSRTHGKNLRGLGFMRLLW
jgi:hypothetical protein